MTTSIFIENENKDKNMNMNICTCGCGQKIIRNRYSRTTRQKFKKGHLKNCIKNGHSNIRNRLGKHHSQESKLKIMFAARRRRCNVIITN